jgi:hypothetical protein
MLCIAPCVRLTLHSRSFLACEFLSTAVEVLDGVRLYTLQATTTCILEEESSNPLATSKLSYPLVAMMSGTSSSSTS